MKKILLLLLIPVTVFSQQPICDLLIRNGRIIDGTGNNWYYGDLAVKNGRIVAIGRQLNCSATKTIDASNMIVSPGFIDVHTHF